MTTRPFPGNRQAFLPPDSESPGVDWAALYAVCFAIRTNGRRVVGKEKPCGRDRNHPRAAVMLEHW